MHWQTSRFAIDLSAPKVMGIVNVTPDSFSDGGTYSSCDTAKAHCELLLADGADILDIGGESTARVRRNCRLKTNWPGYCRWCAML